MSNETENKTDARLKLIELVRAAILHDKSLREKYEVGEKFRFVRERLQALLDQLEKSAAKVSLDNAKAKKGELDADEVCVYVYLYNSQGLQLRTWQNLLNPKVFYEYSVNRPIYADKEHMEGLLRTKTNKSQHGYLTVAIKKEHILKAGDHKDVAGNPIIRVKEGSLRYEKLISFTHQGIEYTQNAQGELIKKK